MNKTLGTHNYYVYILTNKNKTVLYTGVTNDLNNRIRFHRENASLNPKAFTSKYKCFYLIYFEHFNSVETAIQREKQIKGWKRLKKDNLISDFNSGWKFLNDTL
jgi:putative endonuclease